MTDRKPINDGAELFQNINRLSAEADWTVEELRQELRDGGIDPDQLVNSARAKLAQLRKDSTTKAEVVESAHPETHVSLLANLRGRTTLPASQIAFKMGVTVPFLSTVGRYPKVVPISWRRELDARAEQELGTESGFVMGSFEHPYQAQMAASRDEAYEAEEMTPERILDQSGMSEEQRREWLQRASDE